MVRASAGASTRTTSKLRTANPAIILRIALPSGGQDGQALRQMRVRDVAGTSDLGGRKPDVSHSLRRINPDIRSVVWDEFASLSVFHSTSVLHAQLHCRVNAGIAPPSSLSLTTIKIAKTAVIPLQQEGRGWKTVVSSDHRGGETVIERSGAQESAMLRLPGTGNEGDKCCDVPNCRNYPLQPDGEHYRVFHEGR
jgi:hypothetical protein